MVLETRRLPTQNRTLLLERTEVLEAENERLKLELAAARKNSRNSSKPPSSDIVKPPPKGGKGDLRLGRLGETILLRLGDTILNYSEKLQCPLVHRTTYASEGGPEDAKEYRYDAAGRLASVKKDDHPAAVYSYDAAGRRTSLASPKSAPAGIRST